MLKTRNLFRNINTRLFSGESTITKLQNKRNLKDLGFKKIIDLEKVNINTINFLSEEMKFSDLELKTSRNKAPKAFFGTIKDEEDN